MKKTIWLALLLTVLMVVFAACDTEGVQGPQGEQGIQDEKGDSGLGIDKVEIIDGCLIITCTDGTVVNVGSLSATEGTAGLEYYPLPDGTYGVKMGTTQYLEEVVIPATHGGVAVTRILGGAFRGASNLQKITIPNSVTSIDSSAFEGCTSLTSIVIPDSVTSIGSYAFGGCAGLTSIVIPDSVTSIDSFAFSSCTGLTSIVIPDSVTSIGDHAFSYCTSLTSITFEGTVEQWNAITKGYRWKYDVPARQVICSDGTVSI